ncbi:BsuPI-related putative proteinase inhibitor [Desulforamulus ruminis]|uniref:Peptidoglycan-binding lysin domain protein n=1 Tax=Desulforamulus ruminis (strain ATCC 23193 / DSM 2154 / NCIMB 8452 / DL) TaxID=696281 RepID=F6DKA5_DESRL|nr:BsuPI-related putative proteinase inhibitor [Desulforamulus ruminis]AEG61522.1 Peptidoglycan-binding lysin domain protein [Desulforamulus ruminis DSM 2154]
MASYVVQSGDTLFLIAERFNTTMEELQRLNNIENPNILFVGQQLTVPDTGADPQTNSESESQTTSASESLATPASNLEVNLNQATIQYSNMINQLAGNRPSSTRIVSGLLYILTLDQQTYRRGQPVRMILYKVNISNRSIILRYNTGQRFEFIVRRASDNAEVWRYSRGRGFSQQTGTVTIRPNQYAIYQYTWNQNSNLGRPVVGGEFILEAFNVAQGLRNVPIRLRFRIQGGIVTPTPTTPPSIQCTGDNQVRNPGFESWVDSMRPRNWSSSNVRRTNISHRGNYAAEMGWNAQQGSTLSQEFAITPGSNSRISFWVAEDVEGSRAGNFTLGVQAIFRNRQGDVVGVAPQGPFSPAVIEDEAYEQFTFTTGRIAGTAVTAEIVFTFTPRTGNVSRIRIDDVDFRCLSL